MHKENYPIAFYVRLFDRNAKLDNFLYAYPGKNYIYILYIIIYNYIINIKYIII